MATRLCLRIRRLWRKSLVEERMPATCGNAQWRAAAAIACAARPPMAASVSNLGGL